MTELETRQRQVAYWRLIGATFGLQEISGSFERMIAELATDLDFPTPLLDEKMGIDVLLKHYPKLKPEFDALQEVVSDPNQPEGSEVADESGETPKSEPTLTRTLVFSKLMLNVFGPSTLTPQCTAQQYQQWCEDVSAFEKSFGYPSGSLRQGNGPSELASSGAYGGSGAGISGRRELISDEQLRSELVAMESDLVKRMDLRETLKDDRLAAQLTPSISLVEQLLYDKSNLSGTALKNARTLIRKYVDDLGSVLKKQVAQAVRGKIDRSIPPKRVFRNLDVKRTVWKNLHHFNPEDGRVYVDRLHYRQTAQKSLTNYLIVVVDQSGSMVDAMVQCAILASIFATLPRVKVSLIAFDTNVIDLTEHVADPFEVLMRTNLGGGNDGPKAMVEAQAKIVDARKTTMVWISDFYEFQNDRPLFEMIKAVKESGVHFIPVGSVSGSGYFSVNEWFRKQLKEIGLPVLTGNIKKLIDELKGRL
jgi:Mg-chelatase subunit ChlD